MRKLVTIQKIKQIDPIEGKDLIGLASFYDIGWQVIVRKDMYVPGELVLYFEIDSVIPWPSPKNYLVNQVDENLVKRTYNPKYYGLVIKTIKMGGVYSQGLVLKAPILKNWFGYYKYTQGTDLTRELQVKTIDQIKNPPVTFVQKSISFYTKILWCLGLAKKKKSLYVNIPKPREFPTTDETRVQNLTYLFDSNKKKPHVYITTKLDGQSFTAGWIKDRFYVCSRNRTIWSGSKKEWYEYTEKTPINEMESWVYVAHKNDLINKLFLDPNYVVQGEVCGPGIQKNPLGLTDRELYVYNLFDLSKRKFMRWERLQSWCRHFNIQTVPFDGYYEWQWTTQDQLLELAKGEYLPGKPREGIVVRADECVNDNVDEMLGAEKDMANMWSFKVINNDYLV